ncbi:MAG: hypothetical protein ACKERG_00910 [Candidatus Hodgkinia cicadicola]
MRKAKLAIACCLFLANYYKLNSSSFESWIQDMVAAGGVSMVMGCVAGVAGGENF